MLLDDGVLLAFGAPAVQVRALRIGQRVRLRLDSDVVTALTISTLPFT